MRLNSTNESRLKKIGTKAEIKKARKSYENLSKFHDLDVNILFDIIHTEKKQIGNGVEEMKKTEISEIKKKLGKLPKGYEDMITNNNPSYCDLNSTVIRLLPNPTSKSITKVANVLPEHKYPKKGYGKPTHKAHNANGKGRKWPMAENLWLWWLKYYENLNDEMIGHCLKRSVESVENKLRSLRKKYGYYNCNHIAEKYRLNRELVKKINPKSVLEPYAGASHFKTIMNEGTSSIKKVLTNDTNKHYETDYTMDGVKFLNKCDGKGKGGKFDLVDVDPYGDVYSCIETAIKIARKGLIITFGELGHKRTGRLDNVSRSYGIVKPKDFNIKYLTKFVQRLGERHNKKLTPLFIMDKSNIARVYFTVEKLTKSKYAVGGKNKKKTKKK